MNQSTEPPKRHGLLPVRRLRPSVCCICLTASRQELTRRAVDCFRSQTYQNKALVIWDSGEVPYVSDGDTRIENIVRDPQGRGQTVGALRNAANGIARGCDIIINWDSDDWSHPNRIAEQVELLQSSGADVVGYNELMFWRAPIYTESNYRQEVSGEAWIWGSYPPPETTLCYWRKYWEHHPFGATSQGEGMHFLIGAKLSWGSAVPNLYWGRNAVKVSPETIGAEPRMVARIHAGNTSDAYRDLASHAEWTRTPEWDLTAREIME